MLAFLLSITLTNNTVMSFVANSNEYDTFEVPPETFVVLDYKDEIEVKAVFPNGTSLSVQDEEAGQLYTDKNTNVNLYIGSKHKNALVSIHTKNPMTCSQAYIVTDRDENTDISPEDCLKHPYYQKCVDMCANDNSHNFCPHICEKAPSEVFCSVIINSQDLSRYARDVKDNENYTNYIESCYNSLTECDQLCTNKHSYLPVCQYYNCSILIPAMKRAQRTTYHKIHPAMYPVMALWDPSTMTWKTDTIANRTADFPSADDRFVVVGSKEPYRPEDDWNYEWGEQYVLSGAFTVAILSVVVLIGGVLIVNRILSTYQ